MSEKLLAAKIVNTHGIRGEVKAVYYTDSPKFFEDIKKIYLGDEEFTLTGSRAHKGAVLLKLSGIDSIEAAEKLIGKEISTKREEAPLPDGQFFIVDIIGCTVLSEEEEPIGKITDVFPTGSNDVFEVLLPGGKKAYIPNIHDVVKKIDIDNKDVTIHVMEGLIDDED